MTRKRKLLNAKEAEVNERLKAICEEADAHVFTKVRVADALEIEGSGIRDELYDYALRSHFDFLIGDDEPRVLFAVELDRHYHNTPEAQERDAKKNELCELFELPLLRVTSRYLDEEARGMDLLTWLVDVWFTEEAFEQARREGQVSYDEPFDPRSVMTAGGEARHPYWLSLPVVLKLRELFSAGRISDSNVSSLVGRDEDGRLEAISFIRVDEHHGICGRARLYQNHQRFRGGELLEELAILQTGQRAFQVLRSEREPEPVEAVAASVQRFLDNHHLHSASLLGGGIAEMVEMDWFGDRKT